ncbi:MAG: TIGR04282 family arsenosugar biosynthesis glycosyltransferase [Mariprofundaceae bacterium]
MPDKKNDSLRVIIMCKAPVPGFVKTRLCPDYSPEEAVEIHQAMARTVIERATRLFSDVCIASDDVEHPFFNEFSLNRTAQGDGNLGDRMSYLLQKAFADGVGSVLFLGTDSPHMTDLRLIKAIELLSDCDAVIGPVEDGGYDLIAMNSPCTELFKDIRWSSEDVSKETIQRAEASKIRMELLDTSFDLDTAESLKRAAPMWRPPLHLPGKHPEN